MFSFRTIALCLVATPALAGIDAGGDANSPAGIDAGGKHSRGALLGIDAGGKRTAPTLGIDAGGKRSATDGIDAGGLTGIDAGGLTGIDAGGLTGIDAGGKRSATDGIDAGGLTGIDAGGKRDAPAAVLSAQPVELSSLAVDAGRALRALLLGVDAAKRERRVSILGRLSMDKLDASERNVKRTAPPRGIDAGGLTGIDAGGKRAAPLGIDAGGLTGIDAGGKRTAPTLGIDAGGKRTAPTLGIDAGGKRTAPTLGIDAGGKRTAPTLGIDAGGKRAGAMLGIDAGGLTGIDAGGKLTISGPASVSAGLQVAGYELDTRDAVIFRDGHAIGTADIAEGHVLRITGRTDGDRFEALRIDLEPVVIGAVEAVAEDHLVVLGQRIAVDRATIHGPAIGSLRRLQPGERVAVDAVHTDSGLLATRIERTAQLTDALTATISGADPAMFNVTLAGVSVAYDRVNMIESGSGELGVGARVRVVGKSLARNSFRASAITVTPAGAH